MDPNYNLNKGSFSLVFSSYEFYQGASSRAIRALNLVGLYKLRLLGASLVTTWNQIDTTHLLSNCPLFNQNYVFLLQSPNMVTSPVVPSLPGFVISNFCENISWYNTSAVQDMFKFNSGNFQDNTEILVQLNNSIELTLLGNSSITDPIYPNSAPPGQPQNKNTLDAYLPWQKVAGASGFYQDIHSCLSNANNGGNKDIYANISLSFAYERVQ